MRYIENDNVYEEYDGIKMAIGNVTKNVTIRINSETVEDISYLFDVTVGDYVEQSRVQRAEHDPLSKTPQEVKIAELDTACNTTILSGYTSSALGAANTYDFDVEAQINLGGMLNAITAGMVTTNVTWKASGTPQAHTIDQFKTLFADGLTHKNSNIERYWTLKSQVLAATTQAEIDAIVW